MERSVNHNLFQLMKISGLYLWKLPTTSFICGSLLIVTRTKNEQLALRKGRTFLRRTKKNAKLVGYACYEGILDA